MYTLVPFDASIPNSRMYIKKKFFTSNLEYFLPVFNCGGNYAGLDNVSLHRAQLLNTGVVEHLKHRINISASLIV